MHEKLENYWLSVLVSKAFLLSNSRFISTVEYLSCKVIFIVSLLSVYVDSAAPVLKSKKTEATGGQQAMQLERGSPKYIM